jgi:ElaB/YqjD/DUF883 family membrane-anchored ribosome-binding protein
MDEPENSPPGLEAVSRILPPGTQDQLSSDANDLADTAKQTLAAVKDEAAEQFDNIKAEAQDQLATATDKAKSFAGEQKDAAGEQLGSVASAISKVADELQDQPVVAGYAHDLADGIQRVSDTVKTRNVDELLAMAEDFGRSQPVAFLGAAALAGFVASRFVLSSANRRTSRPRPPANPAPVAEPTGNAQSWQSPDRGGV